MLSVFDAPALSIGFIPIGVRLTNARSRGIGSNSSRLMAPLSTGAVYVNDLENEGEDRVRAAYGDKYDRLSKIKREFDPDNFFRVNQNIAPAI
jgi:hypothetical protein